MSRIYVSLWLLIIGISLFLNSWLPIIMIILPPFYGNTILMICGMTQHAGLADNCLLYTSPNPRDVEESRMPSSA